MLEQAAKILSEFLRILLRVATEGVALFSTPNELLCLSVENVYYEGPNSCDFRCGSCHAVAKAPPPPATSEAVIEGVQGLLVMGGLKGGNCGTPVGVHSGPPFCGKLGVDVQLDAIFPK